MQKLEVFGAKKLKGQIQISGSNIDKNNLQFGWIKDYGPIIIRVSNPKSEIVYTEYLKINSVSKNFSITKNKSQNLFKEIYNYLTIGFLHIVPKGLDHILFVIGLFLFSPKFKPLLIQVSAFTIAHTSTIFLGVLNNPPPTFFLNTLGAGQPRLRSIPSAGYFLNSLTVLLRSSIFSPIS